MAERLIRTCGPGSIVLLHDAIFKSRQPIPQYDRQPMLEALTIFLEHVAGGLRFLTIPELLKHGLPVDSRSAGKVRDSAPTIPRTET